MNISDLIKENPGINITVNASDLMAFALLVSEQTAKLILEKSEEKLFSRDEVMKRFGICAATLWRWDRMNLIESKKIGNRVYYPESGIKRLIRN